MSPSIPNTAPCPCGHPASFSDCCQKVLLNPQLARVPETLMRARYSAYKLGGYGQFLFDTWAGASDQGLTPRSLDQPGHQWCGLVVLDSGQDAHDSESGWVTFVAFYKDPDTQGMMHERSFFSRRRGQWVYTRGTQLDSRLPTRKAPCLCGSGQPFKRCCSPF